MISLPPLHFLALLQLCDTALPSGAFAFSYGLETYTQQGLITDAAALHEWLETMLQHTVQGSHLLPVALAYRDTAAENWARIERLDQRLSAMKHAREIREASVKVGQGLLRLARQVWPGPALEHLNVLRGQERVLGHHAVVFGVLGQTLGLTERVLVEAAGYQWLSGIIAAALRLLPLGQTAGQRLLATMLTRLPAIADAVSHQGWDDLASAAPEFDIRAMQHEALYSRLFQS
jgi:urease accessory protein